MKIELTFQGFYDEIHRCTAIEVDGQFVIYPPYEQDGEIKFFEEENQEEPYITVTADWELWKEDGYFHARGKGDFDHDYTIKRLGTMDATNPSDIYAENGGNRCPNPECNSDQLDSVGPLDHCEETIYQECRCLDCGYEFIDIYKLRGFEEVEDAEA